MSRTFASTRHAHLVEADELADLLEREEGMPTLLDVRWRYGHANGHAQYLMGHLPGARYVDLDTELCGTPGSAGRRPLPGGEAFTLAMRRHGVSLSRRVVVYDDSDSAAAARAWWLLRYFGHQNVQVLNGGYGFWRSGGRPVESGSPSHVATGTFTAQPGGMPVIDADGATLIVQEGLLLDARPLKRFLGSAARSGERPGHIPGAISAPAAGNLASDGRLRSARQLLARFTTLGVAPGEGQVGVYCGSGILAAQEVLALSSVDVRVALYPGSWSDWTQDLSRPIACDAASAAP